MEHRATVIDEIAISLWRCIPGMMGRAPIGQRWIEDDLGRTLRGLRMLRMLRVRRRGAPGSRAIRHAARERAQREENEQRCHRRAHTREKWNALHRLFAPWR